MKLILCPSKNCRWFTHHEIINKDLLQCCKCKEINWKMFKINNLKND
jgi:hypothetical protein